MGEKIYFQDIIKNKTYEELMKIIPCMVCREDLKSKYNKYQSYDVVGFGPDYVVLGDYTTGYDEDAFFGSGEYTINTYKIIKFKDISQEYIYAHRLTEKQKEWYQAHGKNYHCVSGYEAWNIIHEAIEQNKQNYNLCKQQCYVDYHDYDDEYDDFYYL